MTAKPVLSKARGNRGHLQHDVAVVPSLFGHPDHAGDPTLCTSEATDRGLDVVGF